jgi:hypothetical protein
MSVSLSLYNFLLYLDYIGPKAEINFKGQPRYQTLLGAFGSILCLLLTLTAMSSNIKSFIYKTNPSVYINTLYDNQGIVLNPSSFQFYINILSFNLSDYTYTPIGNNEVGPIALANIRQNSSGYYLTSKRMAMVECDFVTFKDYNTGFLSPKSNLSVDQIELLRKNSLCLPNIDFRLENSVETQDYVTVVVLEDSFAAVLKEYPIIAIKVTWRSMLLKPNDFKNYYQMNWNEYYIMLDPNKQTLYNLEVENYHLTKDNTFFLFESQEENVIINGLGMSELFGLIKNNAYEELMGITISKSKKSTETLIKYNSLNDVIADFGGTFGVLYSLLSALIQLVLSSNYNFLIVGDIFDLYTAPKQGMGKDDLRKHFEELKGGSIIDHNFPPLKESNKLLLLNNLISSHDKGNQQPLSDDDSRTDDFIRQAVEKHRMNRTINLKGSKSVLKYLCTTSKLNTEVKKVVDLLVQRNEKAMDVVEMIKCNLYLKRLYHVLYDDLERAVLLNNSINIKDYSCPLEVNTIHFKDKLKGLLLKNSKSTLPYNILEYFINSNY